jgi:potassium efflux system protein
MKELLLEVIGWLGYLERGPVVLQVLLMVALFALNRHWRRRPLLQRCPKPLQPLIGPVGAALVGLLLALGGLADGLLQFLVVLWLGWSLLDVLHGQLLHWLPESRVHQLQSRLLRPLYLLAAALLLINRLDSVNDLAVIPVGELFGVSLTLGKVFSAALLTYLLLVGSGPPAAVLAWLLQRSIGISDGSRKALELILRYSVVAIGITALCFHVGLNSTALLAIAGGLSVGLGFGIKEVFSNFISGLWLLFEGSVRPGEVLMIDGDPCEVRRLGLRATLPWRDRDNAELLIPNQTFFTEAATTYTASDRMRRSQVSVSAAYHHDPAEVIALLEQTARQVPRVLKQPAPKGLLLNYGDSAINYALRFWIANPMDNVGICSEVNQAIWKAFKEHNIEIPFPQQVQYSMVWPPEDHTPNRRS